jgi:hypothetical protein
VQHFAAKQSTMLACLAVLRSTKDISSITSASLSSVSSLKAPLRESDLNQLQTCQKITQTILRDDLLVRVQDIY